MEKATGRGMGQCAADRLWHMFMCRQSAWSLVKEKITGAVTGLRRTSGTCNDYLSTDTGVCTIEVSLAPRANITSALTAAYDILNPLQHLLDQMGHTLLHTGIQPRTWRDPARKTRKDWYLLLARRWHLHHWLVPVASHQVSVDVSPREAARAVNVLSGLAGVFTALTASSPIAQGTIQPWKEMRNWIWHERSRRVPAYEAVYTSNSLPPEPYPNAGAYLEHFWGSPMYFLTDLKSGGCEVLGRKTFKELLLSRQPVTARDITGRRLQVSADRGMLDRIHQYGWPAAKLHYTFDQSTRLDDVRTALSRRMIGEYFQEHAAGCYVENRTPGVAPAGEEGATAALTLGLVTRLEEAEALLMESTWPAWQEMWHRASEHGLDAEDSQSRALIRRLLDVAAEGLRTRGVGEEAFLAPLFIRLEQRRTPADVMIDAFRAGGMPQLLHEFARRP
ncbi:glutamate-cysteine ligase family protein [Streptomyces sp. NPDC048187]|uniref:glutamate-cysteine ligase family protein n=1 Tax=Streptomyces sp. NPDC048187 TaxID=3365509 RepID=UPI003713174F